MSFEKYWETTEIHQKGASGEMTGVLESAFKEIARNAWKEHHKQASNWFKWCFQFVPDCTKRDDLRAFINDEV